MNKEHSTAAEVSDNAETNITEEQICSYLQQNLEFFVNHEKLLSKIKLPHDSGKAISLLEKQVDLLRRQELEATQKLKDLLENAKNNDAIFKATRAVILALLNSETLQEVKDSVQEQFVALKNVDACEMIFLHHVNMDSSAAIRIAELQTLKEKFSDAFRLEKTYCGQLTEEQILYLFPLPETGIISTALCPVIRNDKIFALLALGNKTANHFNVHMDTLFLDFICQTLSIIISQTLKVSDPSNLI